jgi:carbonic anhydrase
MHGLDENALALKIEAAAGTPPNANVRFGAFVDIDTSVRASVARLRSTDLLLHRDRIRGFVYEVETGKLREIT